MKACKKLRIEISRYNGNNINIIAYRGVTKPRQTSVQARVKQTKENDRARKMRSIIRIQ
jgi:hypothetical protein